ncbi:MAG: bifunctional demethylmenaquinone methyltransferase/2-methoxy-6-polyprenyl-1,4-benzoquinol methylase UbiE [Planctomycetota bacterium]|nr:MAG: bifunctional demethylmenaquinone methyltransferase/2-methoxy-6-polyprenyl-1,4-benzoquinol methylase UbiE [Planctomycetota bacterium]
MSRDTTTPPGAPVWDDAALADPHGRSDKAARVERMFDAIAPTYERVNALASLGQDARWRRRAVARADVRASDIVLDLCCGTGDMIRAFARGSPAPRAILGIDFSQQMLAAGSYDGIRTPISLCRADALRLPLRDATVDVVSCAFGVRNFQDLDAGLREIRRVLKPSGRVVLLEFATPENPVLRWGYRLYTQAVLPRLGAWISRDASGAYRYLPQSIQTFARRGEMLDRLRTVGFAQVAADTMNFGSVVIYRGVVAGG